MVHQGLEIVSKSRNQKLKIVGAILDSCPGPIPKVSLPRILAIGIVNWICCRKDGLDFAGCVRETSRYFSFFLFFVLNFPEKFTFEQPLFGLSLNLIFL